MHVLLKSLVLLTIVVSGWYYEKLLQIFQCKATLRRAKLPLFKAVVCLHQLYNLEEIFGDLETGRSSCCNLPNVVCLFFAAAWCREQSAAEDADMEDVMDLELETGGERVHLRLHSNEHVPSGVPVYVARNKTVRLWEPDSKSVSTSAVFYLRSRGVSA